MAAKQKNVIRLKPLYNQIGKKIVELERHRVAAPRDRRQAARNANIMQTIKLLERAQRSISGRCGSTMEIPRAV